MLRETIKASQQTYNNGHFVKGAGSLGGIERLEQFVQSYYVFLDDVSSHFSREKSGKQFQEILKVGFVFLGCPTGKCLAHFGENVTGFELGIQTVKCLRGQIGPVSGDGKKETIENAQELFGQERVLGNDG